MKWWKCGRFSCAWHILVLFMCTNASYLAYGQPAEEFRKYKELYPDEELVNLYNWQKLDISIGKEGLKIGMESREENIYLGKNARSYAEESISHSDFKELKSITALTLVPNGKKYSKIETREFVPHDFVREGVFHDDSKETAFRFPNLEKGCKSLLNTEFSLSDPHMLPLLYINPFVPVEKAVFELEYDAGIGVEAELVNLAPEQVTVEETTRKGRVRKTWTLEQNNKLEFDSDNEGFLHYAPQIIVRIKNYETVNGNVSVLENLDGLHNWYCSFVNQTKLASPGILKPLADSIVAGKKNEKEKAIALYDWVKSHIKYVAFEEGYEGYIPQDAVQVCEKRYGDCKGMANLLYNLMQVAGLDARLAWVGTRELPYTYAMNPTPSTDNHMITTLWMDGQFYFMDPTHRNLPFGMPSPFIQEKEVMVSNNCESYSIEKAPVVEAEKNLYQDSCNVYLDGTTLHGKGEVTLTGFQRMVFQDALGSPAYAEMKKFCRELLLKGNNKFILDTVWIEPVASSEAPLYLHYTFRIPGYGTSNGLETYLNLNLGKMNLPSRFRENRELPFEIRFKSVEREITVFHVMDGTMVHKLPDNSGFEHELFTYRQNWQKDEAAIVLTNEYKRDFLVIGPEQFNDWNSYVKKMQEYQSHQITISKTESP